MEKPVADSRVYGDGGTVCAVYGAYVFLRCGDVGKDDGRDGADEGAVSCRPFPAFGIYV